MSPPSKSPSIASVAWVRQMIERRMACVGWFSLEIANLTFSITLVIKQHTVKNILITDVSGYVYFLSNTCFASKHDKKMADEASYSLPSGSYLGQDTGFQGFKILNVNNVQPNQKPRGGELTKDEKEQNRMISKVRVRVEHAIGFVTRCRIVKDILRNWKCGFKDLVMETVRIFKRGNQYQ